jgi:hypothetical protein
MRTQNIPNFPYAFIRVRICSGDHDRRPAGHRLALFAREAGDRLGNRFLHAPELKIGQNVTAGYLGAGTKKFKSQIVQGYRG